MLRCGLLLAACFAVTASAAAAPAVETFTLKNGIRVVLAPDPQARAVDIAIWYATGPRLEPAGRSGITHLFDRLMLHGTTGAVPGEYRRQMLAQGGTVNTFSTSDFTSAFATVPAAVMDDALRLEAERMTKLRVVASELDEERTVVRREREATVTNNPVARSVEQLYAAAYPNDGYGRLLLGSEEDVARIQVADVERYYQDRYGPQAAAITVVGAFDAPAAKASVKRWFDPIPKRKATATKTEPLPPPKSGIKGVVPGRAPVVAVSWRTPPSADPSAVSLDLLARILSRRAQDRPRTREPLLPVARATFDPRRAGSLFFMVGLGRPGADSAATMRELTALADLEQKPVAADEVDRAKRDWELETLSARQTVRGRARELGTALLVDGDPSATERRLDQVRNLTAEDVQAVATKVFRDDARTLAWMKPSGSTATPAAGEDAR